MQYLRDASRDSFTRWASCRKAGKRVAAPATLKGILRSVGGFTRWVAEQGDELDPLRSVPRWKEEGDRRRSTTILTDDQFAKLLASAEQSTRRGFGSVFGKARAML